MEGALSYSFPLAARNGMGVAGVEWTAEAGEGAPVIALFVPITIGRPVLRIS